MVRESTGIRKVENLKLPPKGEGVVFENNPVDGVDVAPRVGAVVAVDEPKSPPGLNGSRGEK